jgi:hypothetical protein
MPPRKARPAGPSPTPGFVEYFVSGKNVVRIASVLGEPLFDHRAVGITKWNRRGVRSKALPDQLDQAHPLLDRELEDFRDISVTHGR